VIHPRTGGSARGRAEEREGWGNGYDLTARMVVKLDCVASWLTVDSLNTPMGGSVMFQCMITKYYMWIETALKELAAVCYSCLQCSDASDYNHAKSTAI
jgi:hypothetical protein